MSNGYLIVKCLRCGSVSRLDIKAVRTELSLCPVCLDGEIDYQAIQCTIQTCQKNDDVFQNLNPYIAKLTKFSIN